MARLYVVNVTPQNQTLCFRLDYMPENHRADQQARAAFKSQTLRGGQQLPIGGDLPLDSIKDLIQQFERYGAVAEADVPNGLRPIVHPFVWNIDRAVTQRKAQQVVYHNAEVKIAEGRNRRKKASVAAETALSKVLGQTVGVDPTRAFEVEFEQETVSENLEKSIAEGYKLDFARLSPKGPPPGQRARGGGRSGGGRRAAAA